AVERGSGRDVGCGFSYPDYANHVRALNGDPKGWGQWLTTCAAPQRLVMHTVGLSPEARRRGLAAWLVRRLFEQCTKHYSEGIMALVVQEFTSLRNVAPPTRHYALF